MFLKSWRLLWEINVDFLIDSEECEEAYSDILSLCEAKKHQIAALTGGFLQ